MSWPTQSFSDGTNLVVPDGCFCFVPRKLTVPFGTRVLIGFGSVLRII